MHPQHLLARLLRWGATPTRFFVVVALTVGCVIAAFVRPFAGDDESSHFARAYAITRGDFVLDVRGFGVGSELPKGVIDEVSKIASLGGAPRSAALHRWNVAVADGPDEFVSYPMATVSPAGHIAMAAGVGVGRAVGAAPLLLLYLARFMNLFVYVGIVWSVLRITPVLRWPLAFIAVFPNVLMVAGTASPDALAVAMVIASICLALVVRDRLIKNVEVGRSMWIASFVVALVLGNAKAPYFLAIGMFVLPWLRSRGSVRVALTAVATVAIVIGTTWALAFGDRYVLGAYVGPEHPSAIQRVIGGLPHPGDLNATAQWAKLRDNPTRLVVAAWRTAKLEGGAIISQSFFDYGLWRPPLWLAALAFLAVFLARASTADDDRAYFTRVERCLLWLMATTIATLMLLSLFVYDTPSKQVSLHIEGMQGRYVAPLLALVVVALPTMPKIRVRRRWVKLSSIAGCCVVGFAVIHGTYPAFFAKLFSSFPQ